MNEDSSGHISMTNTLLSSAFVVGGIASLDPLLIASGIAGVASQLTSGKTSGDLQEGANITGLVDAGLGEYKSLGAVSNTAATSQKAAVAFSSFLNVGGLSAGVAASFTSGQTSQILQYASMGMTATGSIASAYGLPKFKMDLPDTIEHNERYGTFFFQPASISGEDYLPQNYANGHLHFFEMKNAEDMYNPNFVPKIKENGYQVGFGFKEVDGSLISQEVNADDFETYRPYGGKAIKVSEMQDVIQSMKDQRIIPRFNLYSRGAACNCQSFFNTYIPRWQEAGLLPSFSGY